MMTFIEVKGHQRSNVVNYVLWLPNLVRRIPDASLWWWWWPSWRSKVIRGQMRKLCAMAPNLLLSYGFFLLLLLLSFWQFATPSTLMIGFWPNLVSSMYRGLLQKSYTDRGVRGPLGPLGSKTLNNALGISNLVRRTAGASLTWWWPSLRSKVIRGQMW